MDINWRNVAEEAYASYRNSMNGYDAKGNPLPLFKRLSELEILAWESAARTSCDVFSRAVTA